MIKKEPRFNRNSYWCVLILFLMPGASQASVFINEVAWMGSAESANHEWIELYNDGGAVAVDGWTLSDGRNLSIELTGTVPSLTHVVLERTSDASAPGDAFFIYTGALPNTGATLRLENAQGQLIDLVSGGDDWESIGGDNTTKETAQYSSKGWLTAVATPGLKNKTQSSPPEEKEVDDDTADSEKESTAANKSQSTETVRLTLPDVTLDLVIDAQSIGYVHQTIPLRVAASGIGDTLLDSLQYQWNFGDGVTASQAQATHQYAYPGTYVVTVHAQYKRQKQTARHEITILPVAVSLTQNSAKDIQINNDSPYEIDISGYSLIGGKAFTFPPYSIVLPNQTITIPSEKVRTTHNQMLALYDTQKLQLATVLPAGLQYAAALESIPAPAQTLTAQAQHTSVVPVSHSTVSLQPLGVAKALDSDLVPTVSTTAPAVLDSQQPTEHTTSPEKSQSIMNRQERLSYVGLFILILLGVFAVYLTPRREKDLSDTS